VICSLSGLSDEDFEMWSVRRASTKYSALNG
jgi:hypothetical protein